MAADKARREALDQLFATGARSEAERKESGGVALGAKPPASNGPFRAGKGSLYEGGVRVPAFVNWPGKLMPTMVDAPLGWWTSCRLLALAGGKGADDHPFDGKNIWPSLAEGKPSPHEELLINVEAIRGAIRKGDWKLVRLATLPGKTELFNLANDPGEKNNRAAYIAHARQLLAMPLKEPNISNTAEVDEPCAQPRPCPCTVPSLTSMGATKSVVCAAARVL
jgi:arylsulfatase A-like enzyme